MLNEQFPSYLKNFTRSAITVSLLDGNRQTLAYDKTTKLSSLYDITCEYCDIDKDNLFGFAVLIDDYYAFLDLNTKVCKINFKDYYKKSQKNVLFKNDSCSPVHNTSTNSTSRRSSTNNSAVLLNSSKTSTHFFTKQTNNKLNQSTHSAPVNSQSSLAIDQRPQMYWMNSDMSNITGIPRIHFRVKSYVSPYCLRDRATKVLYFQQLLKNVLEYRLFQSDETYLKLAAYALHAHYCHQDSETEASELKFEPRKFVPQHIIAKFGVDWLCHNLPQLRTHLCPPGTMSRMQAINYFINMAANSHFNQHLCPVAFISTSSVHQPQAGSLSSSTKHWLGLSPQGLELHVMNQASSLLVHQTTLKWADIHRISHKKACVVSVCMDPPRRAFYRRLKLHTETRMQGEHLVWLSRHMHVCQKAAALSATQTQDSVMAAEREQYTEKYVYIDSQDRMLHEEIRGEPITDVISTPLANQISLPVTCTPAVPARRAGSKARPKKMKELLGNGSQEAARNSKKQAQYVKKGQQQLYNGGRASVAETSVSITPPPTAVYSMMFATQLDDDDDDSLNGLRSPGARRLPPETDFGSPEENGKVHGRFISLTEEQSSIKLNMGHDEDEDINSETDPGISIPSPPLHPGGSPLINPVESSQIYPERSSLTHLDESPQLSSGSSRDHGCYRPVFSEKISTNLQNQNRLWRSENMLHLNQWSSVSSDDDDDDNDHDSVEISSISS